MNIIITESQLNIFRLLEADNSNIIIDDENIKDSDDLSKVSTSAKIHKANGDEELGKPTAADEVEKQSSLQNSWYGPIRGMRA